MFNLLLETEKKDIKHEYYSRLFVVALCFVVAVIASALLLLVPAYLLSLSRDKTLTDELVDVKASQASLEGDEVNAFLKDAKQKILLLSSDDEGMKPSELFAKVFDAKNQSIKIKGISYTEHNTSGAEIVVRGTSLDRESLRVFGRTLENESTFSKVDLPVSNFAKEKNIDFTIRIIKQ